MRRFSLTLSALALMTVAAAEVPPSVKEAVSRADAAIAAIIATPLEKRTWENTIGRYDDLTDRLSTETSMTAFMSYVHPDPKVRQDSRDAEEFLEAWSIKTGKNEALFKALSQRGIKEELTAEQGRLQELVLRDFRRSGLALSASKRARLQAIEERISKLAIEFDRNIAEDKTEITVAEEDLKGVPLDRLDKVAILDAYRLTMNGVNLDTILDYAEKSSVRENAWRAYKNKAKEKNVAILEQVLRLRDEAARLLGYRSTAAYKTEVLMAKTPEGVAKFYRQLRPIVRKKAKLDYAEFLAAKKADDPKAKELYPWDYAYYKNKISEAKYQVDAEKVSEYFPLEGTLKGLFDVSNKLYGVTFRKIERAALWHPDAEKYEVLRDGAKIGEFYLDLFPRDDKYNHAACWGLVGRRLLADGTVQLPVAALVCNFTKPTADKPSLLTHDEVVTLFHEFGHGLHNLLSQTRYARFAGTNVEQDFVEAPSQMFENWVWDPSVLSTFAKHYKTGEVLPRELLNGMVAARTLGSGLETEHQIYYGMVDQRYHTTRGGVIDTTKTGIRMLGEVELYKSVPGTAFQASFGHLMGYEAAYYSYLWSLVYAQDMFTRFQEKGLLSREAGQYYLDKVLSRGGTVPADQMLRDYLGREPKTDAFLEHLGLKR